jgi:phosphate transport system substrate-binding protein
VKSHLFKGILVAAAIASLNPLQAAARDSISIVGSSSVYPFATVVAERFGRSTKFKTPRVESTGTGGGMKIFCSGVGANTPDISNASRRIKQSEYDSCVDNGVSEIVEVLVGYDGIVIANSTKSTRLNLSLKDIYLALAKEIPGADGKLIPNPNKTWKDVNPALPAAKIEVLGPPPTSGTRDAFAELAMTGGAKAITNLNNLYNLTAEQSEEIKAAMAALGMSAGIYDALLKKTGKAPKGEEIFVTIANAIREDGAYIESGENDNLIVQKLEANPNAMGIFGFAFLDENADAVQGSIVDGVAPDFDSITDGQYPISRPLYFYIKKAHVGKIPGIQEFAVEFTSNKSMGEDGYLSDKGLVTLSEEKLEQIQADVRNLKRLEM